MVLLGLLLALVAVVLAVGLALRPGETVDFHFFGLNIPNLNGRYLVLIGILIGILFTLGIWMVRAGLAAGARRRRQRKAQRAAQQAAAHRDALPPSEYDDDPRAQDGPDHEPPTWDRPEERREDDTMLRHRPEPYPDSYQGGGHDPYTTTGGHRVPPELDRDRTEGRPADPYRGQGPYRSEPYQPDAYASDTYTPADQYPPPRQPPGPGQHPGPGPGQHPGGPGQDHYPPADQYRGDAYPTDAYPTVDQHPPPPYRGGEPGHRGGEPGRGGEPPAQGQGQEPPRQGTVYQSGAHQQPPPSYPPAP